VWHTHSTVTGTATSLGLANGSDQSKTGVKGKADNATKDDDDDDLAAHYASMAEGESQLDIPEESASAVPTAVVTSPAAPAGSSGNGQGGATSTGEGKMCYGESSNSNACLRPVDGVAKPFSDITEEDQELMTPAEYEVSVS
jgi:transcription initiation factor TFIIE subunit alpha